MAAYTAPTSSTSQPPQMGSLWLFDTVQGQIAPQQASSAHPANSPAVAKAFESPPFSGTLCGKLISILIDNAISCAIGALTAVLLGSPIGALGGAIVVLVGSVIMSGSTCIMNAVNLPLPVQCIACFGLFFFGSPMLSAWTVGALGLGTISWGAALGMTLLSGVVGAAIILIAAVAYACIKRAACPAR